MIVIFLIPPKQIAEIKLREDKQQDDYGRIKVYAGSCYQANILQER